MSKLESQTEILPERSIREKRRHECRLRWDEGQSRCATIQVTKEIQDKKKLKIEMAMKCQTRRKYPHLDT